MIKLKKLIISTLLLIAAFGFLALITEMPVGSASAEVKIICDSGETLYCWTHIPYWDCLTQISGSHCIDPK